MAPSRKKAVKEGRTIVFVDESGFRLLPMFVRTWAPCGQTPVLRTPLRKDHLSVIGAVTLADKLYLHINREGIKSPQVVRFLQHLLRHLTGEMLIVWDRLSAHQGSVVKQFLATSEAQRIEVLLLPPYAPDLNPSEGVWSHLKCNELRNVCCQNIAELYEEMRKAIRRLRHKRHVLQGCVRQPGFTSDERYSVL